MVVGEGERGDDLNKTEQFSDHLEDVPHSYTDKSVQSSKSLFATNHREKTAQYFLCS